MLEAIFDLLMSNIFIVILIIGGIYSFFKRKVDKYNEQQNHPGQVQRSEQHPRRADSMSFPTEERSRPEKQKKDRTKKLDTNLQGMYETKREELEKSSQNSTRATRPHKLVAKKRSKPTSNQLLPNPDHIAQGVIWSEILGPPRSRKPHSVSSKMKRR